MAVTAAYFAGGMNEVCGAVITAITRDGTAALPFCHPNSKFACGKSSEE
jgi:hypothetical protein